MKKNNIAAPEDPERAYTEEKLRMRSAKAVMSKNIKKLELSFQEFVVLEDLNLPD